jgi:hypothetical protein
VARTPIEILRQLRRQGVDEAAQVLAARRAEVDVKGTALRRVQGHAEQERAERAFAAQAEVERAFEGELVVSDLQRLAGYEHASRQREAALLQQAERARQALEHAVVQDERAEQGLIAARAEAMAVDRVQQRLLDAERRAEELRNEEEASENWLSANR